MALTHPFDPDSLYELLEDGNIRVSNGRIERVEDLINYRSGLCKRPRFRPTRISPHSTSERTFPES